MLNMLTFILGFFLIFRLSKRFNLTLDNLRASNLSLERQINSLEKNTKETSEENLILEKETERTLAVYQLAREMSKTLQEEKVFQLLQDGVKIFLEGKECRFLAAQTDLSEYRNWRLEPMYMDNQIVGLLAASGLRPTQLDKFHILAQQFNLGLKRSKLYQRVQELMIFDSLTQAYSRRYFNEQFSKELARSRLNKTNLAFLMIDIDHFKDFNDKYGHLVGDTILREVAKCIGENIRQVDFFGRWGGEELVVVLPQTDKEKACFVAERLRQETEKKEIHSYDERLKATISIGVAIYPLDSAHPKELIELADSALYRAKEKGRNRVELCS